MEELNFVIGCNLIKIWIFYFWDFDCFLIFYLFLFNLLLMYLILFFWNFFIGILVCVNGKFYCRNLGSILRFLFLFRINDYICGMCFSEILRLFFICFRCYNIFVVWDIKVIFLCSFFVCGIISISYFKFLEVFNF